MNDFAAAGCFPRRRFGGVLGAGQLRSESACLAGRKACLRAPGFWFWWPAGMREIERAEAGVKGVVLLAG